MMQRIQRLILDFTKDTGLTERREIVHGTLYVKLHEDKECDHFHKVIRTFYIDNINPEDDPYITLPEIAKDDEDTYAIKPTDNLICCAKLDGDMSNIEIHLWNADDETFYVHHVLSQLFLIVLGS